MAVVRVYCGVTAAETDSWLAVAVVDDAGRLLDARHLSDDPAGYALLTKLLMDRSTAASPVAMAGHGHLVTQLVAAANRPLCIVDEAAAAQIAEHFCGDNGYEEVRFTVAHRRAVGLARALLAGSIHATVQRSAWDLDEIKPVLAAHAAIAAGRHAATWALREVLRELYPAALRAFPDPAEHVPLRILDALPEPGMLTASPSSRNRDAALVAELAANGIADTTTAVSALNALHMAVAETPRWNSHRLFAPMVAETVRQSVAAVRANDSACAALVAALVERLSAINASSVASPRPYLLPVAPISPAPRRMAGPAAEVPASRLAPRVSAASAAAAGLPTNGVPTNGVPVGFPVNGVPAGFPANGVPAGYPANGADGVPAGFPGNGVPAGFPANGVPTGLPGNGVPAGFAGNGIPAPRPMPGFSPPGSRSAWPLSPPTDDDMAAIPPGPSGFPPSGFPSGGPNGSGVNGSADMVAPLSFSRDPLNAPLERPVSPGRVPPPWLADDMPGEPPSLRLVGATGADDGGVSAGRPADGYGPPALRVIDGEGNRPGRPANADQPAEPRAQDGDLLIFSQTRSAWFIPPEGPEETDALTEETASWGQLSDAGWRSAEQASHPSVGAETTAGLPRRVPQANLVPGSATPPRRQLRIVRDAASIAAHTSGYFRGWRRGQEIGGFAVGQRDRAAWEFNRDQRAREAGGVEQRARLS